MPKMIYFLTVPIIFLAWFFVLFIAAPSAQAATITIAADTVWTKAQSPVVVNDYIWLKAGYNLTIEPGVIIKHGVDGMLIISGRLTAMGTKAEPIIFTSLKDDLNGGDTNNDGAASSPAPGDWWYLNINQGGEANLDYATIQYGGEYSQGGVRNYKGKLNINHSLITKNKAGVSNQQGQLVINNSSIFNNLSPFTGNTLLDWGVSNNGQASVVVDAKNNWWGTEDGPCPWRSLLPPGVPIWLVDIKAICGDKPLVDVGVNYTPWLTAAPDEPADPDPVILVPGILGSWNISGRWQLDPIFHTYDNLMEALRAAGYKENSLNEPKPTLFTFPYDWREDNNLTAELLKEKIAQVKEITGRDKVDIVAHSMGGLVARSYIQGSDYQNDIDQVIFLGTPHQGAVESYLKYEGAAFVGKWVWPQKFLFQIEAALNGYLDLTDYIRVKVPTVEQLLPVYDYLKDKQADSSWRLRTYPLNYPQNNYLENLNSQTGLDVLKQRVKITNIVSDLGNTSTLNYLRVVADPDPTDNKWQSGYPENFDQNIDSLERGSGDDMVPFISANSINGVESIKSNSADHTNLPTIMQKEVIKSLTGNEPVDYFNNKLISTFKRWAFFRVYSPVDFAVVAPDGKRIGKDFTSNTEINEIPDAFYSGFNEHAEFVLIPNPQDGEYKVELQGVDNGGEYTLANSIIDGEQETERKFTGTIAPAQVRNFNIAYSATSENPISELEPIDTVPPVIAINQPVADGEYLHSNNLIIDYTATDDFSGLASTTITLDGQTLATTTIDLFYYLNGEHELAITAIDKAGNSSSATVKFEIITSLDSILSDLDRLYQLGWITDRTTSKLIGSEIKEIKWHFKLLDEAKKLIDRYIKKVGVSNNNAKTKAKLVQRYNEDLERLDKENQKKLKIIFDRLTKSLNKYLRAKLINQAGYDIIMSDINYLRENL